MPLLLSPHYLRVPPHRSTVRHQYRTGARALQDAHRTVRHGLLLSPSAVQNGREHQYARETLIRDDLRQREEEGQREEGQRGEEGGYVPRAQHLFRVSTGREHAALLSLTRSYLYIYSLSSRMVRCHHCSYFPFPFLRVFFEKVCCAYPVSINIRV